MKEIPQGPLRPIDRAAGWFILGVCGLGALAAAAFVAYGFATRAPNDVIVGLLVALSAGWVGWLIVRAFRRHTRVLMPRIQAQLEGAVARANAKSAAKERVPLIGDQVAVASLQIRRRAAGDVDRLRTYEVWVDGSHAGGLLPAQALQIGLSPGRHVVHLQIDWCRSRRIPFVIAPGQTLALVCAPAANRVTVTLMVSILCKRYIKVRVDSRPSSVAT
jgi:hypothetical protein